jgi:hypothetical protein
MFRKYACRISKECNYQCLPWTVTAGLNWNKPPIGVSGKPGKLTKINNIIYAVAFYHIIIYFIHLQLYIEYIILCFNQKWTFMHVLFLPRHCVQQESFPLTCIMVAHFNFGQIRTAQDTRPFCKEMVIMLWESFVIFYHPSNVILTWVNIPLLIAKTKYTRADNMTRH